MGIGNRIASVVIATACLLAPGAVRARCPSATSNWGMGLTVGGAAAGALGGVLIAVGFAREPVGPNVEILAGSGIAGLGGLSLLVGIPLWIVGSSTCSDKPQTARTVDVVAGLGNASLTIAF